MGKPRVARIPDVFLEQVRSLAFHQLPVKHSSEDLLVTYSIQRNLSGGQIATDGLACFKRGGRVGGHTSQLLDGCFELMNGTLHRFGPNVVG